MSDHATLFTPFRLGDIRVANRIAMAPLTRNRAARGTDAPQALNADYYRQRAGAGLIISEASQISQQGQGYVWTPGIYTDAQVEGWRAVTEAVHAAGGKIVLQLWHVGRISHTSLQPDGGQPVAPSAVAAKVKTYIETGFAEVSAPRALALDEIAAVVADFGRAAKLARDAGFDGVEIHGANGYLLEQFLKDGANQRTDAYGGGIQARAQFTLEVVEAVAKAWTPGRAGIRLSPVTPANGITESDPAALYGYLIEQLNGYGLAFIHVIEGATGGPRDNAPFDYAGMRRAFNGAYIANNGYTRDLALAAVRDGAADMVAFGKLFIANPDLVERLRTDAPLNAWDQRTFYGGDARGYTDYPTLAADRAVA